MANRCADRYIFDTLDLSQPKIDSEFAISLSTNILKEFREPSCRKKLGITNGLLNPEVPSFQQCEIVEIKNRHESGPVFCGMGKII
jgi:hypothetical protein